MFLYAAINSSAATTIPDTPMKPYSIRSLSACAPVSLVITPITIHDKPITNTSTVTPNNKVLKISVINMFSQMKSRVLCTNATKDPMLHKSFVDNIDID